MSEVNTMTFIMLLQQEQWEKKHIIFQVDVGYVNKSIIKTMRKCFNCREEIKSKTDLFCKNCKGKPVKTTDTLVIYNKM